MSLALHDAVDLARYPIVDLDTPEARELIARCRKDLAASGGCEMRAFITPQGLATLVDESTRLARGAYRNVVEGNAYLDAEDPSLPADHPRRMKETTALGVVAYDEFPADALLRRIYEWDPLMRFIGAVLELPEIHRYADPMGGLNLSVMEDGDYLRWHFDQTDFVTSLAIQNATAGGDFEFVPMIRDAASERYDEVRKVLVGDSPRVITMANDPGSLILFRGRHSIHRVTPIKGPRPRLMGLLAYDSRPGVESTDHLRMMRYGRTR